MPRINRSSLVKIVNLLLNRRSLVIDGDKQIALLYSTVKENIGAFDEQRTTTGIELGLVLVGLLEWVSTLKLNNVSTPHISYYKSDYTMSAESSSLGDYFSKQFSTPSPEGMINLGTRNVKGGKQIKAYVSDGARIYAGKEKGLITKGRTRAYHNLGNLTYRPGRKYYEGQVGYEEMSYKGDEGDSRVTRFAIFSDPYYSLKANYFNSIVGKPATSEIFIQDYSKFKKPYKYIKAHGKKVPPNKKTLYRVMSHYAPFGDLNKPDDYAQRIVNRDPGAWPNGTDTMVDLKASKRQFISFYKEVLWTEQLTSVEDWYLEAVYNAMFKGGTPPLQEILNNGNDTSFIDVTSVQKSATLIYNSN